MTTLQTLSILFYLRRDKINRRKEAPVYMRITVNGRRAEMATNRFVEPVRWNNEGGYVKGSRTEFKDLNEYLDILESAWIDHLKLREPDAPTVISTFAGAGGSSLGYSMAGYRELLAVEWDDNAIEIFN